MAKLVVFYLLSFLALLILKATSVEFFIDLPAFLWAFVGPFGLVCILHSKELHNALVALSKKKSEYHLAGVLLLRRLEEYTMNFTLLGVGFAYINLLLHRWESMGPIMAFGFLVTLYGLSLSKLLYLPWRIRLEMMAFPQNVPEIRPLDWRILVLVPSLFLFFLNIPLFPEDL